MEKKLCDTFYTLKRLQTKIMFSLMEFYKCRRRLEDINENISYNCAMGGNAKDIRTFYFKF